MLIDGEAGRLTHQPKVAARSVHSSDLTGRRNNAKGITGGDSVGDYDSMAHGATKFTRQMSGLVDLGKKLGTNASVQRTV